MRQLGAGSTQEPPWRQTPVITFHTEHTRAMRQRTDLLVGLTLGALFGLHVTMIGNLSLTAPANFFSPLLLRLLSGRLLYLLATAGNTLLLAIITFLLYRTYFRFNRESRRLLSRRVSRGLGWAVSSCLLLVPLLTGSHILIQNQASWQYPPASYQAITAYAFIVILLSMVFLLPLLGAFRWHRQFADQVSDPSHIMDSSNMRRGQISNLSPVLHHAPPSSQ